MLLGISTVFAYSVMKNKSKIKQTNKQSIKSEKKTIQKKLLLVIMFSWFEGSHLTWLVLGISRENFEVTLSL